MSPEITTAIIAAVAAIGGAVITWARTRGNDEASAAQTIQSASAETVEMIRNEMTHLRAEVERLRDEVAALTEINRQLRAELARARKDTR